MSDLAQHKGKVKMDISSTATVTTDVSDGVVSFQVAPTKSLGEHFTLGSDYGQQTEGGISYTVKLTVEVNPATGTIYSYLWNWGLAGGSAGGLRTMGFYTPDSTTGSLSVVGEFAIQSPDNLFNVMAGKGDAQTATFTLKSDGTIIPAIV